IGGKKTLELRGTFLVRAAAFGKCLDGMLKCLLRRRCHFGEDRFDALPFAYGKRSADGLNDSVKAAKARQHLAKIAALRAGHFCDESAESKFIHTLDHVGKGAAERRIGHGRGAAKHGVAHLAHEFERMTIIENIELRRHIRLEREAPEQTLAESMDRLDFQSARRLDSAREKAAGGGAFCG